MAQNTKYSVEKGNLMADADKICEKYVKFLSKILVKQRKF